MPACFHQRPSIDQDDSIILFSTSNSPEESTSPSSSSFHHSPPPKTTTLTVSKLSYSIHPNRSIPTSFSSLFQHPEPIKILNSVSFEAKSSEILAIVGPSGTGKSTLLQIVSGRIKTQHFKPRTIFISNQPIISPPQLRNICGFVTQEDNLLPLLTVKETLIFTARFKLKEMSEKQRENRVESLMQELNLLHVADSFVGDEENRGISGGERKRVSIGVDLIHDPQILLLDEPTSGLDSTCALQVIELLSSMAKSKQRTVVLSIHQPGYRLLQYISNYLILSNGEVAHHGSLELLKDSIHNLGFQIPIQLNALEFSMEIIHKLHENHSNSVTHAEGGGNHGEEDYSIHESQDEVRTKMMGGPFCLVPNLLEIMILSSRFWKILYRTKQLFLARTAQALVGGFGLASVYIKVRKSEEGIAERLGLFAFSLSFLLSSTVEALPIFLKERKVLMKEASRGAYRISSYMISNTLVFLPFLLVVAVIFSTPLYWIVGLNPSPWAFIFFTFVVWLIVLMASSLVLFLSAVSSDFISGNSLICTVLGAFFLFSGYFIPKESIPKYWIFMYYVSMYRYPLDSLLVNEYWSVKNECFSWSSDNNVQQQCLVRGVDVLKSRGLEEDNRWFNVGIMFAFFLFYRLLCCLILLRRAANTTI